MIRKIDRLSGRIVASLFILAILASVPARTIRAQVTRGIGAGALVLDDYNSHTLIVQTPQPGDPGYASWLSAGGQLFLKLPLPPTSGATMGFVSTGPATSGTPEVLIWDAPNSGGGAGGVQGVWRPQSLAAEVSAIGAIEGTGTANTIPVWTGTGTTLGNSPITISGGAITFGGYGGGILHSSAAGLITSSLVDLGADVTGTLPVGSGGTGATSFTSGDLIIGNGAGALTSGPAWNSVTNTLTGNITGNAVTATTATNVSGGTISNVTINGTVTGDGSGLTNLTGANVTGTVANATNAVNATNATNSTNATNLTGSNLTGDVTNSGDVTTISHAGAMGAAAGANIIAALTDNGGTLTNNAAGFTGSLAGDVTGTQGATVVSHVAAGALPANVTQQGNTFNGANQLVQLDGAGKLPALDGSALTNVTSANFSGNLSGDVTGTQGATAINTNAAAGAHIVSAINSNASTGTINAANGGTGNGTYATGDILVASSPTTLTRLPAGTPNQVLGISPGGAVAYITNGATVTPSIATATVPTSQNDYTIANNIGYIRLINSSGGSINVSGILSTGVPNGRQVTIVNVSALPADVIQLTNLDATSASENQFDLPGNQPILLGQKGAATFLYDAVLSKWELVSTND